MKIQPTNSLAVIVVSVFCFLRVSGQDSTGNKNGLFTNLKPYIEAGAFLSGSGETPYLLRRNQYGIVPFESQFFTLRAGVFKEYDSTGSSVNGSQKRFSFGYGLNLAGNFGKGGQQIYMPEAYLKFRLGIFELYGGRRKETIGLVDTTLSSGAFAWSGNALPLPKIQLGIPNYIYPFGQKVIAIKGAYSHGWFEDAGGVTDFYLHQKWFYMRFGKETQRWKFYLGGNHQVQWGGYNTVKKLQYQKDLQGYLSVVLSLKEDSVDIGGGKMVGGNRVGNQLGSFDLGFEYTGDHLKVLIYRQNLYEQGAALLRLANIQDGLNGVSFINVNPNTGGFRLNKLNLEYFYSFSQGRHPILFTKEVAWELEDYFASGEYPDGWTYKGKTIGTPLITPSNETKPEFYGPGQLINNNRVKAFQIGFDAQINSRLSLLMQGLYTYNNGKITNYTAQALSASQTSVKIQAAYSWGRYTKVFPALSIDRGDLYSNNSGFSILLQRTFNK